MTVESTRVIVATSGIIRSSASLAAIVSACGQRAKVEITLREDRAGWRVRKAVEFKHIEIEPEVKMALLAVAKGAQWHNIPRTFQAFLDIPSDDICLRMLDVLVDVVERIDVLSFITPAHLSSDVKALLAERPDVYYDKCLFLGICDLLEYRGPKERVGNLPKDATMADALFMLFFDNVVRKSFFKDYILEFDELKKDRD